MLKDNVVLGLLHQEPDYPEHYCAVCKNSREDRLHFGSSIAPHPPNAPLDYVHADLMGFSEYASLGGHLYTCRLYDHFTGLEKEANRGPRRMWGNVLAHCEERG
jgi:hypothetical protein